MHRFFLPPAECTGPRLLLPEREAHHAVHVLRLQAGQLVTVLDGAGTQLACEVADVNRKKVELAVRQRTQVPQPAFQITLLQAIVKGKTMETIIQKSTELGVSRIVPLQTERVVAQLDREGAEHKQNKWQLTAIEALKQCGSPWLPQIGPPVIFS